MRHVLSGCKVVHSVNLVIVVKCHGSHPVKHALPQQGDVRTSLGVVTASHGIDGEG
jgi:hypothetical protein